MKLDRNKFWQHGVHHIKPNSKDSLTFFNNHFSSLTELEWNSHHHFTSDSRISFARSLMSCDGFMFSGSSSSCSNRAFVRGRGGGFIVSMVTPQHNTFIQVLQKETNAGKLQNNVVYYCVVCFISLPKILGRQNLRPSWLENWKHSTLSAFSVVFHFRALIGQYGLD